MSNNKSFEVFIPYATSQVNADILKILSSSMSKKRTLADRNNSLEIVVSGKYDLLDPEYLDAPDEYYIEDFDKVYSYHYLTFENRREFSSKSVILPIIKLSDEAFEEIIGNIPRGVDEIELGYYPGTAVSIYNFKFFSEYVFKNRIAYIKNKKFTGKTYTFGDLNTYVSPSSITTKCKEYLIDGEKYIFIEDKNGNARILSSYKVEPIKWKIDRERKTLIAMHPVLGGIPYNKDKSNKPCPYKDSYLYYFLNEIFLKEAILDYVNIKDKEVPVNIQNHSNEIETLISEISVYVEYYHGSDDINSIVKSLIDKYNADINSLKTNTGLILYTEEGLYNNLVSDLNRILDKLKRSSESSKEYHDILELINNCIDTFNGKPCESDNELYKDILNISNDILPSISKDEDKKKEIKERLLSLFIQDKDEIETYLKYITTFSDGINLRIDYKTLQYKNIKEYERYFRMRLHPVLERMVSISKESEMDALIQSRQDILNKIKDDYTNSEYVNECLYLISIFRFARSESNNKHIDFLINSIKEEYNKLSKEVSEEELKGIITYDISSNDINDIANELNEILKRIYNLSNSVQTQKEKVKRLNNYLINI